MLLRSNQPAISHFMRGLYRPVLGWQAWQGGDWGSVGVLVLVDKTQLPGEGGLTVRWPLNYHILTPHHTTPHHTTPHQHSATKGSFIPSKTNPQPGETAPRSAPGPGPGTWEGKLMMMSGNTILNDWVKLTVILLAPGKLPSCWLIEWLWLRALISMVDMLN